MEKKTTGVIGEEAACNYLISHGHTILDRNWRTGHLEVDIISLDLQGVHFVEVKTRRPPLQGMPEEAVNYSKQKRLASAAKGYMKRAHLLEHEAFFDIVSVVLMPTETIIEYFPQAFIPISFGR